MAPDLALQSTLNGSNNSCLELIFMVPKVFEPLKFDCMSVCSDAVKLTKNSNSVNTWLVQTVHTKVPDNLFVFINFLSA